LENWITIRIFNLPIDAAVIRAKLEAEGIECFLENEIITQVNPLFSNAVGGVKLKVKESDVKDAIEILKEGGYYSEEIPPHNFISNDNFRLPSRKQLFIYIIIIIVISILLYIKKI
jgi:hypothetical protein